MPLPGFRRALVVGLVLLALGVGLASTHATASAQAPPGGTITTQLQPGWNMIGWLGPDTSAGELFDAIPALNFIVAWDGGAQRYRWVWRASLGLQALPWIQAGPGPGPAHPRRGRRRVDAAGGRGRRAAPAAGG